MTFYVERFNGDRWVAHAIAQYPIGPHDLKGREEFPSGVTPGNSTDFSGIPGSKCRVRMDDRVIEEFDWVLIRTNPLDPESDLKWGWKSTGRHAVEIPQHGALSYIG